jgi:hypothetical protein
MFRRMLLSALSALALFVSILVVPAARAQGPAIEAGARARGAPRASSVEHRSATVSSVVVLRNKTGAPIKYSLQFPGQPRRAYTLAPSSSRLHWARGQNVAATINFDRSFAPGYQDQAHVLASRDFLGIEGRQPSRNADGMQYSFTLNSARDGLRLHSEANLNKLALAQYRARVTAGDSFPRLLSNFEVVAAPTRAYNCIAWSLGYQDRWLNPVTSSAPNRLAGMDRLYAQQGYRRLRGLDFSYRPGYQKVVVYATLADGAINKVTHAAIQSADGAWTSKLGESPRIKHLYPDDVAGGLYGALVAVYVRRVS